MKRLLSMLLVLCMAAAWLPAGALAQEAESTELPQALTAVRINPLYADVLTEADIPAAPHGHQPRTGDGFYHSDPAVAGVEVRNAMENREGIIQLNYLIPVEDYTNEGLDALIDELWKVVFAHTGVPTQGDYLRCQYGRAKVDAQGYGRTEDRKAYKCVLTMTVAYYTDLQQENRVTQAVDQLLAELNPTGTDYERLTTVYDWICDNVAYDYDRLNDESYKLKYTAYAALVDRTAVCQGYAALLYRLALTMGIDCRIITGIGITNKDSGAHAWNILKLGGKYYDADATWDINFRQRDNYRYYLLSEENFSVDHIRDEKYTAGSFLAAYPMGKTNYEPGMEPEPEPTAPTEPVPEPTTPTEPSEPTQPDPSVPSGTCGENVTWTLVDGTLTVSGTGPMYDYEFEKTPWYAQREEILRVVVTDGVTRVGQLAFAYTPNLTEAILSDSVTEIGPWAFWCAEKLPAITLPQNLVSLEQEAFGNCYALEQIELPGTLTFIDADVFTQCYALTRAVIHAAPIPSLMVGNSPFRACKSLEAIEVDGEHFALKAIDGILYVYSSEQGLSLLQYPAGKKDAVFEIPQGTYEVNQFSLEDVPALEEIVIPDGVQKIWGYAFQFCPNLNTVRFLGDAPELMNGLFSGVTATIYYPANNPTWTEDVMQDYGGNITWIPEGCGDDGNQIIASGISEEGFCWELDSEGTLTISGTGPMENYSAAGGGYTSWILANLDPDCEGTYDDKVKKVVLSEGITSIGMAEFFFCKSITSVQIPATVTSIGAYAFSCCTNLKSLVIPNGVTTIDFLAFELAGLTSIVIPESVTMIGDWAFVCEDLECVTFIGDAPEFGFDVFEDVKATVYYPANNPTWTADVMHSHGGTLTWVPYEAEAEIVPGDVDGDGVINDADVARLLWHILFPDTYEVSGNADYNGDGRVDDQDVAYLLWHTLFPEQYPIN